MQAQTGRPQWKLQQRAHNIKNWSKLKNYDNGKENYTRGKQQKIRWCRRKDSVQFSRSVVSDSSRPSLQHTGFPVLYQLPELTQTHVHWVSDTIQPSHPLLSPSPAFNLSQHQGLFQGVIFSHQVTKVLEFQLLHQSFQLIFRTDSL